MNALLLSVLLSGPATNWDSWGPVEFGISWPLVAAGNIETNGNDILLDDSDQVIFGTGGDTSLTFDGTSFKLALADCGAGACDVITISAGGDDIYLSNGGRIYFDGLGGCDFISSPTSDSLYLYTGCTQSLLITSSLIGLRRNTRVYDNSIFYFGDNNDIGFSYDETTDDRFEESTSAGLVRSVDTASTTTQFHGAVVFNSLLVEVPSADQSLSAGTTMTVTNRIMRVVGNGGAVTLTSTPHLTDASDGVCTKIQGTDDTNTVTLQDESNLANSGMQLSGGADFTLGQGDILEVCYDSGDDNWYEVSRSNN